MEDQWSKLSLMEQLGNIASEWSRVLYWKKKGNQDYVKKSFERCLGMFDLSLSDKRWQQSELKEIAKAREVATDCVAEADKYAITPESLSNYFLQFALAARKDK